MPHDEPADFRPTNERREELIKRSGIDPIQMDKRPLGEILNDEIPYQKWDEEMKALQKAGFQGWQDYLSKQKP